MTPQWRFEYAIKYAVEMHDGQVDKGGKPYILHVLRVMDAVAMSVTDGDYTQATAAVLHDVVEDTPTELWEIESLFGHEVFVLVDALTRREGERYFDYIDRVKQTPAAIPIKLTDLRDNMRPDRVVPGEESMKNRYQKAYAILSKEWVIT